MPSSQLVGPFAKISHVKTGYVLVWQIIFIIIIIIIILCSLVSCTISATNCMWLYLGFLLSTDMYAVYQLPGKHWVSVKPRTPYRLTARNMVVSTRRT